MANSLKDAITLGIIADTHIPDRIRRLRSEVPAVFAQAGVSAILHAGDIASPKVLAILEEIAPVHAVRGNRDWVMLRNLPLSLRLTYAGTSLILTHGHGRLWNYVIDHFHVIVNGYEQERFRRRLDESFKDARVIIFGHTHHPLNLWVDGRLFFNPGSPHFPWPRGVAPSIGLLHLSFDGQVQGEIIELE